MNNSMFLLGDVARLAECKPHQIAYLLASRQVPEPAIRLGNRRIFTEQDIARIREKLKVDKTLPQLREAWEESEKAAVN